MKDNIKPGTEYTINGDRYVYRFNTWIKGATVRQFWFFDANGFSMALLERELGRVQAIRLAA